MVVDDLDVMGVSADPPETDSKLVVDADAVLSDSVPDELLETVGRRHFEVGEGRGGIEHDELSKGDALKIWWKSANLITLEEALGIVVAKAANYDT